MRHLAPLILPLVSILGFQSPADGQQPVEAEEYAVWSAVLEMNRDPLGRPLTIASDGLPRDLASDTAHLRPLVRRRRLDSRPVADFEAKNSAPYRLEARLTISLPYVMRSIRECLDIRSHQGLEAFEARCPELKREVVVLSRVGFDPARTVAIVRMESYTFNLAEGHGSLMVLVKRNGRWTLSDLPVAVWMS